MIFLRQKKNGEVKARSCANGNPQREHIAKEEAAAPTVALESVFLILTIDAKENREVVTSISQVHSYMHITKTT